MGRRSINTTKSGKYMNPTDQARKEARKRELKKNKRQRMTVRLAVLKSKDPHQLLEEMEKIDQMEYDPTQPPQLNERVLKEKRRKLKETYDRVIHMYEKEDPDYASDLKKSEIEYEKKRLQLQLYYEQVKNAEKVKLDMIPLPEAPSFQPVTSSIPLPGDIPLPSSLPARSVHGILKKSSHFEKSKQIGTALLPLRKLNPPGPPPGTPPSLSDDEDGETPKEEQRSTKRASMGFEPKESDSETHSAKKRKIRFEDDETHDPEEEEKDTRIKFKSPGVLHTKSFTGDSEDADTLEEPNEELFEPQSSGNKPPHILPSVPVLPPGPPPMMFRMPPGGNMPQPPPMLPPRMLPPGPPPRIRPPGMTPQGLPVHMGIRGPVPPPGLPPGMPPNRPPPSLVGSAPSGNPQSTVLTGVPTYVKAPTVEPTPSADKNEPASATIVAKPKIRNLIGDATRFTPTAVKIKREFKDSKGQLVKPSSRFDNSQVKSNEDDTNVTRNDDAYDLFMREMKGLI